MDIESVITREEYDKMDKLDYDQFSELVMRIVKLSVEESLKVLPSVLNHLVYQSAYLKSLSDKFYKDNKDLANNKQIMAKAIESVEGKNPGLSYEEILKEAAKEARSTIAKMKETSDVSPKNRDHFDSKLNDLKLFEDK